MIKWLLNKKRIKEWIDKQIESKIEKPKFNLRLSIGLFLIIFSFVEYYGGAFLASFFSLYFEEPKIAIIGIPGAYGLSWVLWIFGMFLLGKENYQYSLYRFALFLNYLRN